MMSVKFVLVACLVFSWCSPCNGSHKKLDEHFAYTIIKQMKSDELKVFIESMDSEQAFADIPELSTIIVLSIAIIGGSQGLFWLMRKLGEKEKSSSNMKK